MLLRSIRKRFFYTITIIATFCVNGFAQRLTHGVVVDSVSFAPLAGVHVKIKSSREGEVTNAKGEFYIKTMPTDTLVLSRVGYVDLILPLLFEEQDILIRLRERVRMLQEITIRSTRLQESQIVRSERTMPRKMSTADAFSSPWDYFHREQREKRKVVKLINENNRVKTYVEVVHDQLLREEIIYELGLSEVEYYAILAQFNKQSNGVLYSTDKVEIINTLKTFFRNYKR
jgi:hypothetical protein